MLTIITGWLAKEGVGLVLGALAKMALDAWQSYQANQALRQAGAAETANKINQESADAERRAGEVAVNQPDVDDALAGWADGKKF